MPDGIKHQLALQDAQRTARAERVLGLRYKWRGNVRIGQRQSLAHLHVAGLGKSGEGTWTRLQLEAEDTVLHQFIFVERRRYFPCDQVVATFAMENGGEIRNRTLLDFRDIKPTVIYVQEIIVRTRHRRVRQQHHAGNHSDVSGQVATHVQSFKSGCAFRPRHWESKK